MSAPIAIIAGQGDLPVHLSRSLIASGREVILAELDAFPADNPDGLPLIPFRVEKLGALFKALRKAGVEELVFAGSIRRPRIDPKKFDLKTVTLAPKFMAAIKGGDDGTLRAVLAIFEGEGFAVRAAHEVMPSLLPAAGIPTQAQPSKRDRKDTARAARIVRAMAAADVGQGAVVAQGLALALEAVPGTDVMLDHVAEVAGRWRREGAEGKGVLFKGPKAGQDRRIDLPVIGPSTMRGAAKAGLSGVAIDARGVMVLDLAEVIRISDAEGLFLWIREPEQGA